MGKRKYTVVIKQLAFEDNYVLIERDIIGREMYTTGDGWFKFKHHLDWQYFKTRNPKHLNAYGGKKLFLMTQSDGFKVEQVPDRDNRFLEHGQRS